MIDVILGNAPNKHFLTTLSRVLESTHVISIIGDGTFSRREGSDFLLWETTGLHQLRSPSPILILPEPFAQEGELTLCEDVIAVANSQHPALLSTLAKKDIRVISCGLQTADTLTLSSYTGESAVVNLQRNLVTFSGNGVEPGEFPLALTCRQDPFTILAIAAVYLLSDNQTELSHLTI